MTGKLKNWIGDRGRGNAPAWALLALYLFMLALNVITPMAGDEYVHYSVMAGEHIRSLSQIAENLKDLWQNTNGRVLAHFFVYLMQIPPRVVFSLLNAAVLPLLLWLLLRFLPEGERKRLLWLGLGGMLLWCWMPGFGEVFLWLTGSCNYGWSLPLLFAALLPFYRAAAGAEPGGKLWQTALWCLCCLACAAYNESNGVCLLAAAFLLGLSVWIREKRLPWRLTAAFACGCLGFLLLLSAPATLATRVGGLSLLSLVQGMKASLGWLETCMLPLYLFYALLMAGAIGRGVDRRLLLASAALLLGGLASVLALSAAAYLVGRSFAACACLTSVACLVLAAGLPAEDRRGRVVPVAALLGVLFAFSFLRGTGDVLSLYLQSRERTAAVCEARESGRREVTLKRFVTTTGYAEISYEELEESPECWYNDLLAKYYGLERVYGLLPETGTGGEG